ncbi:MAG TPA: S8 family serine peptidase, partial [Pyrinomonadaceae bacterium]|nr:S8 family serine peptidase [Pyrinomonadaceae bacterium]
MASEQEINTLIESKGMRRVRKLRGRSGLELLGLLYDQNAETAAADLRLNNVVEFAEANYIIKSDTFDPGNQRFYKQWPLTDRNNGLLGPARGSANSLITTQGLGSTVIAVIDSGIDWTHPDLSNKQWVSDNEQANSQDDDHDGFIDDQSGWDFVAESGHESDEQGHGTAVAGLIATQGNSAISIAGVMWQPRLMSLRVLDATGTGDVARAIEAIDYAGAHGAKVINCSWGTNGDSQALGAAIERAAAHGVVVVCSAGNAGRDIETAPRYPASFDLPNIIAVASSDNLDQLAPWSNWGALHVAVAAPGVNVSTTKVGGGYQAVSGTSASAAVVSGMVGLIKSLRPGLSAELTKELVMRGARRVAALQGKVASGGVVKAEGITGMVNVLPPDDGSENVSGGTNAGSHNSDISPREEGISVPGTMGDQFRVAPPEPTRGTPGPNLPNLDEMRHLRATPPRAQPPIPSTRCSSHIDCGQQKPAAPADEPSEAGTTDTPIARQESVIVDLLTFNKDFPAIESLLGRDTGPVSDSPFTLKLSSHIAGSQPSSLMPVLQTGVDFSTPRLDPVNRTGTGGEDLISGNYNWNLPLVALPGRAGLDLGLSLSYNSLVWTKSGSSITYDADRGFPSPGFRLGFPTIQQRFYNTQTGIYAYLLITPSGSRVELRQVGASNVYEAADSSYLQLTDYGTGQMLLRTTEGTQLSYSLVNAEYRCTQIKDRNGNFITANYDVYGHITTIIDTLGRTLTFTYDVNHNPTAITQLWNGVTHQWVTFGYANLTIQTTYSGLSIVGLQNGSTIPVLSQVSLHDGSAHRFSYSSWGQVYRIAYYAFDGHQRRQLTYNLPQTAGVAQSDCPRFTQRRDWAENWNGDAEGVLAASEEAVTTFGAFNFAGGVRQATMPDNTIYKEFFQTTGWQKGLTTRTEILSGAVLKKWTTTAWTQDDISLLYQKNPRVTETNIYDAEGNRRRTTIGYGPYAAYGLPYVVSEYAADAATIVRETYTDYNLSTTYLNQRIIGLVSAVHITNGQAYQAKIAYSYDATGTQLVATSVGATRHDAGYGTSFAARGNLTSVSRYDVTDINNTTKALTATLGYDIDGSVIFSRDEQGHQTSISYTDSFSDSVNRNTFAYPTTVTDADNYSSTSQYSYELGAVTRLQDPKGAVQTREYDEAGRIKWVRNPINSAWQFFAYPDRG